MGSPYWLKLLELVCSSFFTLEFLMRLVFCPTKLLFFKRPMNWIDLISILPFYVSQVSDDDKVKMFLVIRVLRLFRYVMVIKKENRSILPSLYKAKLFQKWFNTSLGLKENLAESYESKEKKRSVGVDWFIAARADHELKPTYEVGRIQNPTRAEYLGIEYGMNRIQCIIVYLTSQLYKIIKLRTKYRRF